MKENEERFTINNEGIKNILSKYSKDFKSNIEIDLPVLPVLDGYIFEVYFKVDNTWYDDCVDNFPYYEDKDLKENKHLYTFDHLIGDVYEYVYKQNKECKKYFAPKIKD